MKRLNKIDILRALGIWLMISGHVFSFFGKFDRYIHTFHMPLFFCVSGFLFQSRSEVTMVSQTIKKAKRLLLPYVTYGGINYAAWFLLVKEEQVWYEPLRNLVTYNTSGLPICGALWFLTALFWTEVFYLGFDRMVKNSRRRSILVITVAVFTSWIQNHVSFRLPLTMDTGVVCMGFYEIGRLCRFHGAGLYKCLLNNSAGRNLALGGLLAAINALLAFVNPYVNIKSGWYGVVPLFWLNALVGVAACFLFTLLLDQKLRDNGVIKRYFVSVGTGSIVFLGFNQLAILCTRRLLKRTFLMDDPWINSITVFVIVMAVLQSLYMVLRKSKNSVVKSMFGI